MGITKATAGTDNYEIVSGSTAQGQRVVKKITTVQNSTGSDACFGSLVVVPEGGAIADYQPTFTSDLSTSFVKFWGKIPGSVVAISQVGPYGNTRVTHNSQIILNSGDRIYLYLKGGQTFSVELDVGYQVVR